jgi:LuxR family maltose regulon positive regulatory protein
MSSLLATKLHCPSTPPKRVQRPQLIQRLNEGLESGRQITLVSAPAGFGKTTCISEWIDALELPVAWLSLDPADDDPGHFFTYLIAALQTVDANLGQEIEGILRAGQLPPAEIISTTLGNDLLDLKGRFLLVLDDFQVIQDPFILQILGKLLENPPPPLHLILLTREDPLLPLARLRANNRLTEVRAEDLRFTAPEADSFLNEVMKLSLSAADVDALERRTEGWIVGLHLAGLSIRGRDDPSEFIASLSGNHRFILNYLTEEVISRQSEEIQHFLLQTSILDRLNSDLCNAVTGRADSSALLEQLYHDNLFLIPLDEKGGWYRYHQLFADMLRDRQATLLKDNLAERHRRASGWYAGAGMVSEAIQHALIAADYAAAIHLIESHAMDMLMQWHVKTVDGWMKSIPPEWCAQSPRANLSFAWLKLMRGNPEQAFPYLSRLGQIFADPQKGIDDPALTAKWLAIQSMMLNAQGKSQESLQLCKQALELFPAGDAQTRIMIDLGLANAYQQMDDYEHAVETFQNLIQLGQTTGNAVSELLGISALALLAIQHGQLHFAYELAAGAIERVERSGSLPPICMAIYGELAVLHYQWHELDQAHHYFQRAIQLGVLSGYSDAELFYSVILSRLFQIRGDLEAAACEIQKAVDLTKVQKAAVVQEEIISQQVRIHLAQGNLLAAELVLKGYGELFKGGFSFPTLEGQVIPKPVAILYISALRILLYRAREERGLPKLKPGIALAGELIDGALQHEYIPFALELLLVLAQLYGILGDEHASQTDYTHALALGQVEGYISIFIEEGAPAAAALKTLLGQDRFETVRPEYIRKILAAFQVRARFAASELLTEREQDVLRLMAGGMKYEEIAKKLFISLNTVRSHIKAIYGKFGVENRTKAIEMGRQMRIL